MSCGSGLFARRFAKSGKFESVIAADFSESMLNQARLFFEEDTTIDPRLTSMTCVLPLKRLVLAGTDLCCQQCDVVWCGKAQAPLKHAACTMLADRQILVQEIYFVEGRCWAAAIQDRIRSSHTCWGSHSLLAQSYSSGMWPTRSWIMYVDACCVHNVLPGGTYHMPSSQALASIPLC